MTEVKESKKSCFIITPIGNPNSEIRRHIDGINNAVIKPVLEDEMDYKVSVSHEIDAPGDIPQQVIMCVRNSDLVIANLTGNNPNVMYEIALRHCFGKSIILIAEEGTNIPADITGQRTFYYKNDPSGVIELKAQLRASVKEIEETGEIKNSGPVYDALRNAELEQKVLEDIPVEGNKDIFALILRKLDEIQMNVKSKDLDPKKDLSEKKNAQCIYHIHAQAEINDKQKMSKIADIFEKKPLGFAQKREIEEVSDNYIKLMIKGVRGIGGVAAENMIRAIFKEQGIMEVTITKQIEELPVI